MQLWAEGRPGASEEKAKKEGGGGIIKRRHGWGNVETGGTKHQRARQWGVDRGNQTLRSTMDISSVEESIEVSILCNGTQYLQTDLE